MNLGKNFLPVRILCFDVYCLFAFQAWAASRYAVYFIVLWHPRTQGIKVILFGMGALTSLFIVYPGTFEILFLRAFSIFDIINDTSNASRIELMGNGIVEIVLQPWGLGFGSLSSIGYTLEQVWASESVRVTESSILSFIGELGVPAAAILFVMTFLKLRRLSNKSAQSVLCPSAS